MVKHFAFKRIGASRLSHYLWVVVTVNVPDVCSSGAGLGLGGARMGSIVVHQPFLILVAVLLLLFFSVFIITPNFNIF